MADMDTIISIVMAGTVVVLACFLIPALWEIRRAAATLRTLAEVMNNDEIKPLLSEIRQTVADVKVLTKVAADNADSVQLLMEELGHMGQNIRSVNRVVGGVSSAVATSSVWMTGARVAGRFLVDKLLRKRG